jgi:hypothetical protein
MMSLKTRHCLFCRHFGSRHCNIQLKRAQKISMAEPSSTEVDKRVISRKLALSQTRNDFEKQTKTLVLLFQS